LCICDALFGSNEANGPGGITSSDTLPPDDFSTYVKQIDNESSAKNPCTVIMSTDPVTAEMQAIKLIRMNKEKNYGPSDLPAFLQSAAGVDKSGFTPTYNVGIMDESDMTIYRIINDEIIDGPATPLRSSFKQRPVGAALSVHSLNNGSALFVEYTLPERYIGKDATFSVFSVEGKLIQSITRPVTGIRSHFSWNRKDRRGKHLANGRYVARLICGGRQLTADLTLL
jgi:hypothetical protein